MASLRKTILRRRTTISTTCDPAARVKKGSEQRKTNMNSVCANLLAKSKLQQAQKATKKG